MMMFFDVDVGESILGFGFVLNVFVSLFCCDFVFSDGAVVIKLTTLSRAVRKHKIVTTK